MSLESRNKHELELLFDELTRKERKVKKRKNLLKKVEKVEIIRNNFHSRIIT